ncbi:TagA domain-containing protein, partial [Providencia rettgeri]
SKNIHLPDASSRNAEDTIIIETCTDWDTTVHLNGETEKIKKNEKITYISDGKSWVKSHLHGLHKKPIKQDVPVITVLGFYDPEGQILVTDPEKQKSNHVQDILYGSSGMVYKDNKKLDSCSSYLEFDLEDGTTRQYKLHGTNFRTSHMNRFHVNIERDLKPVKVKIFIKGELKESKNIEIRELKLPTTIN